MSSPTPKYQMGDYIDDNYEVHATPPGAPSPSPSKKHVDWEMSPLPPKK